MLSRGFHGSRQLLKTNCVVVPLNSPKLKPFQSFSIHISWSSSPCLPQSNGWHSSFIFGSPRFRYQPGYRLHCLNIQWFSLHPSGKWRDRVFKIHGHFFAHPFQLTTQPIFPPLGAVTLATDSHARKNEEHHCRPFVSICTV